LVKRNGKEKEKALFLLELQNFIKKIIDP